jgi:3-hydroxyacyl-[acyl-carrier-protein] dehydratase
MRFVMLNELLTLEPGRSVEAAVTFPADADLFADHFPGCPVVPGTLITEAMGQAAGWLIASMLEFRRWPLLTMIDGAKFRRLVLPGEHIRLRASLRSIAADDFEVQASAAVGGQRVADARLLFHAFDLTSLGADAGALERWARSVFSQLRGDTLVRDASPIGGAADV